MIILSFSACNEKANKTNIHVPANDIPYTAVVTLTLIMRQLKPI